MTTATRYVADGSTSSTLYFGPWYKRSPFFEKTLEAGCSAYDIYNHMYLPGYYADLAVLSGNPLTATAEGLLDISCTATMVGGRWVYGTPS